MNKLYVTKDQFYQEANDLCLFTAKIEVCTILPEDDIYLQLDENGLCIITSRFQPLYVKDIYNKLYIRKEQIAKELLIQAVKQKPDSKLLIIDATAGLGKDSLLLALYGYKVLMIEQNPVLATIVYYGLLKKYIISNNLQLVFSNSIDYLKAYTGTNPYAIYLDPMFKKMEKSLAKKEMQIIQLLVEETNFKDEELFFTSYNLANKVIVKRDSKQIRLVNDPKPTYNKDGKTVRYDVYVTNK